MTIEKPSQVELTEKRSLGQLVADNVAATVGSWRFIIAQSIIIIFWITGNSLSWFKWDTFPFIFLNLALSFQAAYTAPIIMMSQNRGAERDRLRAEADYSVNVLAEKEIETILNQLLEIQDKILKHAEIKDELSLVRQELGSLKKDLKA